MDPTMVHDDLPPALNAITGAVLDSAIKVHTHFGPGLYEKVYERALAIELRKRGHSVREQLAIAVTYEGQPLGIGYRADLVVDDCVLVELKAVDFLTRMHIAQILSYLRNSSIRVGCLINFHAPTIAEGYRRFVL